MPEGIYVAMNRFRVAPGQDGAFEEMWRSRTSRLAEVPGYVSFHLLRGPATEEQVLYASHTIWESEAHFQDWTRSEQFRAAHAGAGQGMGGGEAKAPPMMLGPPQFEGFTAVLGGPAPGA